MNLFSTYHPALIALQSLHDQFKGSLSIYAFFYEKEVSACMAANNETDGFIHQKVDISDLKPKIQDFRKLKKEIFWGDKKDLPFTARSKKIQQLSIQDEIEQNILIIRITSPTDDAFDVFAIEFSKTFSNFYIPNARNNLSSEMKLSLGKTIRNQMIWVYKFHKVQKSNIHKVQVAYQQSIDTNLAKDAEIEEIKRSNNIIINNFIHQFININETRFNCNIKCSSAFLQQLIHSEIKLDGLGKIIDNACSTAYDLTLDKSKLYLTPNLIHSNNTDKQVQETQTIQLVSLNKTIELLDKYERAARKLDQNNQRINGKNLAATLKVSGPAISDALKNHQYKIKRALKNNPDSWPLISNYIRPIREIKWELRDANTI